MDTSINKNSISVLMFRAKDREKSSTKMSTEVKAFD